MYCMQGSHSVVPCLCSKYVLSIHLDLICAVFLYKSPPTHTHTTHPACRPLGSDYHFLQWHATRCDSVTPSHTQRTTWPSENVTAIFSGGEPYDGHLNAITRSGPLGDWRPFAYMEWGRQQFFCGWNNNAGPCFPPCLAINQLEASSRLCIWSVLND